MPKQQKLGDNNVRNKIWVWYQWCTRKMHFKQKARWVHDITSESGTDDIYFTERDACMSDSCDYKTLSKSAKIRLKGIKLHDTELREFTSAESLWSRVCSTLPGLGYTTTCGICFKHQLILMSHYWRLHAIIFYFNFFIFIWSLLFPYWSYFCNTL